MNPERWREVEKLYHAALERASGERAGFLQEACHDDQELRSEVESLLAQETSNSAGLIDRPVWEARANFLNSATITQLSGGNQIGPYRIEAGNVGVSARYFNVEVTTGRLNKLTKLFEEKESCRR